MEAVKAILVVLPDDIIAVDAPGGVGVGRAWVLYLGVGVRTPSLHRHTDEQGEHNSSNIAELDRKIGSLTRLLVDPDIDAMAKRAVSRQVGELETERERLQNAVAELANDANGNTARLAGAVRQTLAEAEESLATPTEMRDFIEQHVGPMVLRPDGDIKRKDAETPAETNTAPAEAEAVKRSIAGAGFEPATSGL